MWATRIARCRIQYPYTESICDCGCKWRVYADTSKKLKILGAEG